MSRKKVLRYWYTGAALAGVVVAAVAALLLAIIVTARSIRANALRIQGLAQDIVTNTRPIWKLADTDSLSGQLLLGARAISQHASEIADSLEGPRAR